MLAERSARPAVARIDPPGTVAAGPILLVCGSAHPLNRAQAEELHRQRRVPICELRIEDIAGTVRAAADALGRSGSVSLVVGATRTDSSVALRALVCTLGEAFAALQRKLAAAPPGAHVYVCGPQAFITGVQGSAARAGWPRT